MANGRLAGVDMPAGTYTQIYEAPADTFAVVTVSICNRGSTSSDIRLTLSESFPPGDADYLEFDTELLPKGVLERTGIVVAPGQKISGRSSATNVSFVVYGIETQTI